MVNSRSGQVLAKLPEQAAPTRSSADVLAAMLAQTTDRISIVDRNYRYLGLTHAAAKAWNMEASEIVGMDIVGLLGEDSFCNELKAYVDRALAGESVEHRFWHRLPDGHSLRTQRRYMDYRITPWVINDSQIVGAVIRVEDLTDRARDEQNLVDSEQRLHDFATATSDWFWEMDSDLCFTWISRQLEAFFDIDRTAMYGTQRTEQPDSNASPEEAEAWQQHRQMLEKRLPFRDFEYRVSTRSGDRWARVSGVPVFDGDQRFVGYRGTASDVTDLKNIAKQVDVVETRYKAAMDEFPGSFALFDDSERLQAFNKNYSQIHAYLGDELKPGLHYQRGLEILFDSGQIPPHQQSKAEWVSERVDRFRSANEPVEICRPDGRWYRLSQQRMPDGGCLETLIDITRLKQSELALKEERNLLRTLIDNIPDFIYAKDKQARFIVKNRAVSRFMDSMRELSNIKTELPAEYATDFDYYPELTARQFRDIEMRIINDGQSYLDQEENVSRRADMEPFWISTTKVPLRDTSGEVIGLVGTGRNINARKAVESRLRNSEARFRDFAETAADLFWEMDANMQVCYVSERYQELTGFPPEAILGKPHSVVVEPFLIDPNDREHVNNSIARRETIQGVEVKIAVDGGEPRYFVYSGKPYFDADNIFGGYRGAGRDITEARKLETLLSYQASHDELTRLPNRREFVRRLEMAQTLCDSNGTKTVLGYLDLDQFKLVNDSVGHLAGDQLLVQVTDLISRQLRKCDTVARLGGDEFGLLLEGSTLDEAVVGMQRLLEQFDAFRFCWNGQVFCIGVSIGLAQIDGACTDVTELMSRADAACFAAKDHGRGRVHVYRADDKEQLERHSELLMAAGIRESLANDRFCLYAQPIVKVPETDVDTLQVVHYEILLRLLDEDGSLIYPGNIIPAAQRFGLMGDIDRWVIQHTFERLSGSTDPGVGVTINLSGHSLSDETLYRYVKGLLDRHAIDASRVCFEITETEMIRNFEQAREFIQAMRSAGCAFALDDFGSGLSSFGYLKNFSVDYLKIDGSFVRDIATDATDRVMVASINQIGKALGIKTIAEFVENDDIVRELRVIGVDMLQGYGVGKPVPLDTLFL